MTNHCLTLAVLASMFSFLAAPADAAPAGGEVTDAISQAFGSRGSMYELRPHDGRLAVVRFDDTGRQVNEQLLPLRLPPDATEVLAVEDRILLRLGNDELLLIGREIDGQLRLARPADWVTTPRGELDWKSSASFIEAARRTGCTSIGRRQICELAGTLDPDVLSHVLPRSIGLGPGRRASVRLEHRTARTSEMLIELSDEKGASRRMAVKVRHQLGAIDLAHADKDSALVIAEDVRLDSSHRLAVTLVSQWFDRQGRLVNYQVLPLPQPARGLGTFEGIGRTPKFAVSVPRSRVSEVLQIRPSLERDDAQLATAALDVALQTIPQAVGGALKAVDADPVLVEPRKRVVERALAYVDMRWFVRAEHLVDPAKRPINFRQQRIVSKEVYGAPYNWGGFQTVTDIRDRLDKSRQPAGAINKDADGERQAGVDCSGFVSQVWQSGHLATADMALRWKPAADMASLQPGDALVRSGDHVVLLKAFVKGHGGVLMRVVESSPNCSGTCQRDRPFRYLIGAHFVPMPESALAPVNH